MASAANLLIQKMWDVTVASIQEPRLLDARQLDALSVELYRLVDELDRKKLVLDCAKVQFLTSSAIGVLVNLQKKSTAIKGTLIICGVRKELMQVFEITKLTKLFKFAADEKAALKLLGYTSAG